MLFEGIYKKMLLQLLLMLSATIVYPQAPANDDCSNAELIVVPNNGYSTGTFASSQINLTSATIQSGETFAPALSAATIDKKSAWFKFSLSTTRAVRITISQPGTAIPAGDAGFTVYENASCLPSNTSISTRLTPIVTFGNTYHPCVPAGDYLIQVAGKAGANGPINITVDVAEPAGAAYDRPASAYSFGVASNFARRVDFDAGCHSTDETTESCPLLSNGSEYRKTAWFTFTTPAYSDYIIVTLSGTNSFFINGGQGINKKFGYALYRGDAITTPVNSLTIEESCDSLLTDGYHGGTKEYVCNRLLPNTTYSIQLFMPEGFTERLRLGIITGGTAATVAPLPVTGIAPSHALGNLTTGTSFMIGYFGCNSRHSITDCSPATPAGGVNIGGHNFNLSSFGTFTLPSAADVNIRTDFPACGQRAVIRLFKQGVTNNCADLNMTNLVGVITTNSSFPCLSPGDYTVQIMGLDSALSKDTITYKTPLINTNICLYTNLGSRYVATITTNIRKAINQFSLTTATAVDSINVVGGVQLPIDNSTAFVAVADTFGCGPTVRPSDMSCYAASDRLMYRQFSVADSGTVIFETLLDPSDFPANPILYRLYKGDAAALASAQNIFAYPGTFAGLVPNTECFNGRINCDNKSTCVVPGTYTFTTMGTGADIGRADQPTFRFTQSRTIHNSPLTAQDMGNIIDTLATGVDSVASDVDTWSCENNAVPVNGDNPCNVFGEPASKAIYRQFYLKEPSHVRITHTSVGSCGFPPGIMTLYSGKATDGLAALSAINGRTNWRCFNDESNVDECELLQAGWYTVISWASGPGYNNPMQSLYVNGRYNGYINYTDQFEIRVEEGCKSPQFNRPYKASVQPDGQPHLFEWAPRANNSSVYPQTFKFDTLPTEYFNCTADTPFSSHPILPCSPSANKVAYYVFKTTQVSFLYINNQNYWCKLYNKDVRLDSLQFDTAATIGECNGAAGYMQYCNLQPGTYTLVLFADSAVECNKVTPEIYIDSVARSRFDFAQNAYDFGVVPPDSLYHFGKVGDVNPIDAGRPPSSDIFFCTTGASISDPGNSACNTIYNANIYSNAPNQPLYDATSPITGGFIARRNLWYTFVVAHPGKIYVRVQNQTGITQLQPQFAVYRSNIDGTIPFAAVQSNGQVDSTTGQGLRFLAKNYFIPDRIPPPCYDAPDTATFYRPACELTPTRYYVVVDNVYSDDVTPPGGQLPNSQVDVSVLIDSLELDTKFDHYYQAGEIVTAGPGVYTGEKDNYSCATRDAGDPLYTIPGLCNKTIWYKITPTFTGNIRYRIKINNNTVFLDSNNVKLFRQSVAGDSTFNGLSLIQPEKISLPSGNWSEACVSAGTYYLLLPGCGRGFEDVVPEIELTINEGDVCSNAVSVTIAGAGNASNSVKVNCHTIGTDYGEFGSTLTCPPGAATMQYKTSWFRMDVTGTDTLDVTASLAENTNAVGSDIKYRMMTGDCGAMQEQSCVLDGLTQNTYQCLVPGQSYYIQVITPVTKNGEPVNGTIELRAAAVAHTDSCAPFTNCLATANFTSSYNCSVSDSVRFSNYSTFGSNIMYEWNFGYNGQTSAAVSPSFLYPYLLRDSVYNVRLVVKNTGCNKNDTLIVPVTVPARGVDLGSDIIQCDNSVPVILKAPVYTGAVYIWQDNSRADSLIVTATGQRQYHVTINNNGCISSDTINVYISPIVAKPLQNIFVCSGTATLNGARGLGETYLWNNGERTASISVNTPGIYWVDISLNTCTYRDSFDVSIAGNSGNILGNDTTICFSNNNYVLNAFTQNAVGYTWQDGSSADTLLISSAGQYSVAISLGSCIVNDTIIISSYPAPQKITTDTAACNGSIILLPWGTTVNAAGLYTDTLLAITGCDSLIRIYNVSFVSKPALGNDTITNICTGSSINLNNIYATGSNTNNWSTGNNTVTDVSNISNAGNYQLITITAAGCSDTVMVSIAVNQKPVLVINNPAVICSNSTTDISAATVTNGSTPGLSFSYWQDATATTAYNNMTVATGGTYYIKGTDANNCFDIKPVAVSTYALPQVSAGNDIVICNNDSVLLTASANSILPVSYLWQSLTQGGIKNPTAAATIVKPGTTIDYTITVTDSCNLSVADTITVVVQPPVKAFAGNDTIAVTGQPHQLSATGGINYAWQPATILNNSFIANPLATIYTDSILFTVIVKDAAGCTGYDTVKIKSYKGVTYYVPNAFSPNGDGKNDVFRPLPVGIASTDYFRIFNRYGEIIFETTQITSGWNGTYKGKLQQPGNYIWMLKGRGQNGKLIEMKGNVVLVR
jgi:gliding motility-associated-like protein